VATHGSGNLLEGTMAKKVSAHKSGNGRRGRKHRMMPLVVAAEAAHYGIRVPSSLPPSERFLSPNEIGRILNVTGEAVKQWIYHRRLPATKLSNGYWKIKVQDLEDFIKARRNLGQKKIMVIDAAGPGLGEVVSAIEKLGHQPVVARNAADAVLKAADLYPSLFVVNVSLTHLDAWKLMQRVRKTRNIRNAPILIVADHDLKDSESEQALELGAQGFLRRPFKVQTLVDELEKILCRIM
jgi:CheY-like chemotaxis protein